MNCKLKRYENIKVFIHKKCSLNNISSLNNRKILKKNIRETNRYWLKEFSVEYLLKIKIFDWTIEFSIEHLFGLWNILGKLYSDLVMIIFIEVSLIFIYKIWTKY